MEDNPRPQAPDALDVSDVVLGTAEQMPSLPPPQQQLPAPPQQLQQPVMNPQQLLQLLRQPHQQQQRGPALRRDNSVADSAASVGTREPWLARAAQMGNPRQHALRQTPGDPQHTDMTGVMDMLMRAQSGRVPRAAETMLLRNKVAQVLASLLPAQRHALLEQLHRYPDFACLFSYNQDTGRSGVIAAGCTLANAEHEQTLARLEVQVRLETQRLDSPETAVESGQDAAPVQAAPAAGPGQDDAAGTSLTESSAKGAVPSAVSDAPAAAAAADPAASAAAPPLSESLSVNFEPEFDVYSATDATARVVISLRASAQADQQQGNVAVTSVLDVSGSMAGRRLDLVKQTSHFLVQQVTSQDLLGFVSYSDHPRVDVPMMYMTPVAKKFAHTVLECLDPEGGTALHAGAVAGMQQQLEPIPNDGKLAKALFLCTDGEANIGPQSSDQILPELHKQQSSRGQTCTIHTFGIGDGHCAELLQAVAESMSGTYYYIQSIMDVAPAYGDALGGLLSVMAKNVRVTVTLPAAAAASGIQLLDMSAGGTTAGTTVTYNDIYAEETRELLLSFKLPAAAALGSTQDPAALLERPQQLLLAEALVEYVDPATGAQVSKKMPISISHPLQQPADAGPAAIRIPSPLVLTTAARYETASIIKQAQQLGQLGRLNDATNMLNLHASALASASGASAPGGEAAKQLGMLSSQAAVVAQVMQDAERNKQDAGSRQRAASTVTSAYQGLTVQRTAGVGATSCLPHARCSDNMSRQTQRTRASSSMVANAGGSAGPAFGAPPGAGLPFGVPPGAGPPSGVPPLLSFSAAPGLTAAQGAGPRAGPRFDNTPTPPPPRPPPSAGAPFSFSGLFSNGGARPPGSPPSAADVAAFQLFAAQGAAGRAAPGQAAAQTAPSAGAPAAGPSAAATPSRRAGPSAGAGGGDPMEL